MATATATSKIDAALEREREATLEYEAALEDARVAGAKAREADEHALELEALAEMGKAPSKDATKARTAADKAAKKARIAAKIVDMAEKAAVDALRSIDELQTKAEADRIADRHAAVRELTQQLADLMTGAEKAIRALEQVYDELAADRQPLPHRKLHGTFVRSLFSPVEYGGTYATFLQELREFGYEVER